MIPYFDDIEITETYFNDNQLFLIQKTIDWYFNF